MRDSEDLRRAIGYSLSGGFLAMVFGVLGAAAAQAAPPKLVPGPGEDVPPPATRAAPPPPAAPMEDQNDRKARAIEDGKRRDEEQARKNQEANDSEDRRRDSQARAQQEENKKEQEEKNQEWNDSEDRRRDSQARAQEEENERKKDDDRETRKFENQIEEGRKQKEREKYVESVAAVAEQSRRDRAIDEIAKYEKAQQPDGVTQSVKAWEIKQEIKSSADKARAEANLLASARDEGVTGSVRAWETTDRLADEAEAEAQRLERIRDVGRPDNPLPADTTLGFKKTIVGSRATVQEDATLDVDKWVRLPGQSGGISAGMTEDGRIVALSDKTLPPGVDKRLRSGWLVENGITADGKTVTVFHPKSRHQGNVEDFYKQVREAVGTGDLAEIGQAGAGLAAIGLDSTVGLGMSNGYGAGKKCATGGDCGEAALEGVLMAASFVPGGKILGAARGVASAGKAAGGAGKLAKTGVDDAAVPATVTPTAANAVPPLPPNVLLAAGKGAPGARVPHDAPGGSEVAPARGASPATEAGRANAGARSDGKVTAPGPAAGQSLRERLDELAGAAPGHLIGKGNDPLVPELVAKIDARYPGHVRAQGIEIMKPDGKRYTDFDIVAQNAVIQVKSGRAKGAVTQAQLTQRLTDLPVIVYVPDAGDGVIRSLQRAGIMVTRDEGVLLDILAP